MSNWQSQRGAPFHPSGSILCFRFLGVLYDDESRVRKDGVVRAIQQHSNLAEAHFVLVNENDTLPDLCTRLFDSFRPNLLIDVSQSEMAAKAGRALGLPLVSANTLFPQAVGTGRHVAVFKSPDRLLLEAVRDAITHFALRSRKVRVLYDQDYGEAGQEMIGLRC